MKQVGKPGERSEQEKNGKELKGGERDTDISSVGLARMKENLEMPETGDDVKDEPLNVNGFQSIQRR
ncbi:MAG: hypothetical protein ACLQGU_03965 [bacterium]